MPLSTPRPWMLWLLVPLLARAALALGSTLLTGATLLVKDGGQAGRKVVVRSRDSAITSPAPASSGDPTANGPLGGGRLSVFNPLTQESASFTLPAGNWQGLGQPPGSAGYKYVDTQQDHGPCKMVVVRPGRQLKALCSGDAIAFSLDEPTQGTLGVGLRLGGDSPFCLVFGPGAVRKDTSTANGGSAVFKGKNASAPVSCPQTGLADVGTLVVLGDSLSTGQSGECANGACPTYSQLLETALEAAYARPIALLNEAVGGARVADVLGEIQQLPGTLTGPVAVVLTAGGNNLLAAGNDPSFPTNMDAAREAMGDDIDTVLDTLLLPDRFGTGVEVHVFWANFHDPSDGTNGAVPGFPDASQYALEWIAEIEARVTAHGEQRVDMYSRFLGHGLCATGAPGVGSWLYTDCVHLNAIGEGELGDLFTSAIRGLL